MKKILFLGNLYHAIMPLVAEMEASEKYDICPVVEDDEFFLKNGGFYGNIRLYENVPKYFNVKKIKMLTSDSKEIDKIIENHKPDIILVRCWTNYENLKIKDSIYWKIESMAKRFREDELSPILPPYKPTGFLVQNKEEMPFYKKQPLLKKVPMGYFPRGVSHYWEKPQRKEYDIMVSGTATNSKKIESFEILVKILCEKLPEGSVRLYVSAGNCFMPWAEKYFQPLFYAGEGPKIVAKAKLYISPVTQRYDKGIVSHKIIQSMGCRTCTITHHYTGVEDMLGPDGENVVYADSAQECLAKVKWLLKDEYERERIAERAYKFVHSEYNYTKLFENAMKQIGVF